MFQRKFKYLSDAIAYRNELEKMGRVTWIGKQESPEKMYIVEYSGEMYKIGDEEV